MLLWVSGMLALGPVWFAAGYIRWSSSTFDYALCDNLLPYPDATLRDCDSGVVPYRAQFTWCDRRILAAVVVGRWSRTFTTLIGQVRDEQNNPIGKLRSHRAVKYTAHDCHGEQVSWRRPRGVLAAYAI